MCGTRSAGDSLTRRPKGPFAVPGQATWRIKCNYNYNCLKHYSGTSMLWQKIQFEQIKKAQRCTQHAKSSAILPNCICRRLLTKLN